MKFETENATLICGDCIEKMAEMPDNSVDLTVTSPPYDDLITYEDECEWWLKNFTALPSRAVS